MAVLDAVQRTPQLLSYLQTRLDQDLRPGSFVLTGSQQFGLLSGVTQSLAGSGWPGATPALPHGRRNLPPRARTGELLFRGAYPPLSLIATWRPADWPADSTSATYVEQDSCASRITVRDLSAVQSVPQAVRRRCAANF